eukprot:GHVT01040749.1.p1 GENE.GHVT01040749.1~~GHVT01040749.1.p1  ORF type:complete len:226 (+),score=45.74 GHVT01040749.1:2409-3086(+)
MDVLGATAPNDIQVAFLPKEDHVQFVVSHTDARGPIDPDFPAENMTLVTREMQKMVLEEPAKFWATCNFEKAKVDELVKQIRRPTASSPPPSGLAFDKKINMDSPGPPPASRPASPLPPSTPGSKEGWTSGSKVMAGIIAGGVGLCGLVVLKLVVGAALRKARPFLTNKMQNMAVASDAIDEQGNASLNQTSVTFKSKRKSHYSSRKPQYSSDDAASGTLSVTAY